jgi:hypothetical protein
MIGLRLKEDTMAVYTDSSEACSTQNEYAIQNKGRQHIMVTLQQK